MATQLAAVAKFSSEPTRVCQNQKVKLGNPYLGRPDSLLHDSKEEEEELIQVEELAEEIRSRAEDMLECLQMFHTDVGCAEDH